MSRGGSFTEHRIQQAALSYALRLIYLTALEEFALFKEMESFSLYSKPLLTSFSPGFFAIKNERVMSIRRLDPTASLGEHDPAVQGGRGSTVGLNLAHLPRESRWGDLGDGV